MVCIIDSNYSPIQISSPGGAVFYQVTAGFLDIVRVKFGRQSGRKWGAGIS